MAFRAHKQRQHPQTRCITTILALSTLLTVSYIGLPSYIEGKSILRTSELPKSRPTQGGRGAWGSRSGGRGEWGSGRSPGRRDENFRVSDYERKPRYGERAGDRKRNGEGKRRGTFRRPEEGKERRMERRVVKGGGVSLEEARREGK
eukprot:1373334-Amorphochlora_amoeboformis.AAC.1